jgi:uncharacterized protein YfeS
MNISKEISNPQARIILTSDIYWEPSNTKLPFNSDSALDTLAIISNSVSLSDLNDKLLDRLYNLLPSTFDLLSKDWNSIETLNKEDFSGPRYFSTYPDWLAFKEEMEEDFEFPSEQEALFAIEHKEPHLSALSVQLDQIIIAAVFYAFIKFGKITPTIIELGKAAVQRELLDVSLMKFPEYERTIRKNELAVLFVDLIKIEKVESL